MCESFCSPEYKSCCLVINFIVKPNEKEEKENGELSFKPFCDLFKAFGNTLLVTRYIEFCSCSTMFLLLLLKL
jgi:hypothetical protein